MNEVCGLGDGTTAGGLAAIEPELTWSFRKVFDRLDTMADELRRDRSRPKLAAAITLYHFVIEASMAQPGQHYIEGYLTDRELLPGFRAGMHNVSQDSSATSVSASSCCRTSWRRTPSAATPWPNSCARWSRGPPR